jgi:hypothetical protein
MIEALISNFQMLRDEPKEEEAEQLALFENSPAVI